MASLRRAFLLTSLLGVFVTACTFVTDLDGLSCGAACDVADATDATLEGASSGEASTLDTTSPAIDAGLDSGNASDTGRDAAIGDSSVVDALTYLCPNAGQVANCATCAGGGYPCVLCGSAGSDVKHQLGICVTSPSSGPACQGKGPAGYDDCLCTATTDPSPCPLPYQVCAANNGLACRTCGWDGGAGLSCKGGGLCSGTGVCK